MLTPSSLSRCTLCMPDRPAPQRELFAGRPDWEEDDVRQGMVATVVLPEGVDKPLDYLVPPQLAAQGHMACPGPPS